MKAQKQDRNQTAAKAALKIVKRPRPEPYSMQLNMRVRPSEKARVREYAEKNGVTIDTVLRSALVAAGVLAA